MTNGRTQHHINIFTTLGINDDIKLSADYEQAGKLDGDQGIT